MRELTEEYFPYLNKPAISSEGFTYDEVKHLVNLGQRFIPFSDEHREAIWEQITLLHDENRKESDKIHTMIKQEEPEFYAEFVKILAEEDIDAPV